MSKNCRSCGAELNVVFADLGMSPLANSFIPPDRRDEAEKFYPLCAYVCETCFLVQLEEFETAENIFSDYLYFSSFSDTWLAQCQAYARDMTQTEELGAQSLVVEIASNDGYLLQYFKAAGVPVLGVEPAANVAKIAVEKGVATEVAFFGEATAARLARDGVAADVVAANNVLAHVPDINDFVAGVPIILKPNGVFTIEFPHLLHLVEQSQFDTIYHEHFSYLSLYAVSRVLAANGLRVFDVDELPTHGGSLRVFACHKDAVRKETARVAQVLGCERDAGLLDVETYRRFAAKVVEVKCQLLSFLIDAWREGKTVAGYGAPAKGNTLLNYCGVKQDLLSFTVDRSDYKQGHFLPGTRIPIFAPSEIMRRKPDYVLILPWNLKDEIAEQMKGVRAWGGKFVTPIPHIRVF